MYNAFDPSLALAEFFFFLQFPSVCSFLYYKVSVSRDTYTLYLFSKVVILLAFRRDGPIQSFASKFEKNDSLTRNEKKNQTRKRRRKEIFERKEEIER